MRSRFENFVEIQKLPRKHEPGVVRCTLLSRSILAWGGGDPRWHLCPEPQVRGQTHSLGRIPLSGPEGGPHATSSEKQS